VCAAVVSRVARGPAPPRRRRSGPAVCRTGSSP